MANDNIKNNELRNAIPDYMIQQCLSWMLLEQARQELYKISGGGIESGDVTAQKLTTEQMTAFYSSPSFRALAAAERALGKELFSLHDGDKTLWRGDCFTDFFRWRVENNKLTPLQRNEVEKFLLQQKPGLKTFGPEQVLNLWQSKELSTADFWLGIYWQSQLGMTLAEKQEQVQEFAPTFADKIYPGVADEHRALEAAGVIPVLVSNSDQELAKGFAPYLGMKPENMVGSFQVYGPDGRAIGFKHTYEIFTGEWVQRPQPGKHLNFHYWIHSNRERFGWQFNDDRKFVLVGRYGDSASADGGMMILLPPPALGNFMIDTPNEPDRIQKFYPMAAKYGWNPGQFFTVIRLESPAETKAKQK